MFSLTKDDFQGSHPSWTWKWNIHVHYFAGRDVQTENTTFALERTPSYFKHDATCPV